MQQIERDYGRPVVSIVKLDDLIEHLAAGDGNPAIVDAIRAYRDRYGA